MPNPSYACDLQHGSGQWQTPDALGKARDWTCIFMDTSQIPHDGNSQNIYWRRFLVNLAWLRENFTFISCTPPGFILYNTGCHKTALIEFNVDSGSLIKPQWLSTVFEVLAFFTGERIQFQSYWEEKNVLARIAVQQKAKGS